MGKSLEVPHKLDIAEVGVQLSPDKLDELPWLPDNMMTYTLATPPHSPSDIRMFLKKKKSGSARRALTELGVNNSKENLRMAAEVCSMAAEQFKKRWDFDPILGRPVDSERYQWTAVKSHSGKSPNKRDSPRGLTYLGHVANENVFSPSSNKFKPSASSALEGVRRDLEEEIAKISTTRRSEGDCRAGAENLRWLDNGRSPRVVPKTPSRKLRSPTDAFTPRTIQCKITDYGRQRKRLYSLSKCEETEVDREVTGPRKRLVLSPIKTAM